MNNVSRCIDTTDRDNAIIWARGILKEEFVVLDTETTGLGPDAEIVQIGIIDQGGNVLVDSLVKPTISISASASGVHGITDDMVKNAPGFAEILPAIDRAVNGKVVLIYNKNYDQNVLMRSAIAAGVESFEAWWVRQSLNPVDAVLQQNQLRWQCAMIPFAEFYGEWNDYHGNYRWQKLTTAAKYFHIDIDGAHGTVADCRMTLAVVQGMAGTMLSTEKTNKQHKLEQDLVIRRIQTASYFLFWLHYDPDRATYSIFCNDFGYEAMEDEDRRATYQIVMRIIELARGSIEFDSERGCANPQSAHLRALH